MEYVVDVQGFQSSLNDFIFKEVAIISLEEDAMPKVFYFRSPYGWNCLLPKQKSANRWLEKNFHGIPWSSGEIPQNKVQYVLWENLRNARKVYLKGIEKKRWLQDLLPNELFHNVEDLGCPSIYTLNMIPFSICSQHPLCKKPVCALQNVYSLSTWMLTQLQQQANVPSIQK